MAFVLLRTLMKTFNQQIEQIIDLKVEAKLQDMVTNRNTLQLMDDAMLTRIKDIVDEAVQNAADDHTQNYVHNDSDDIERIAGDTARETLSEYAERQEGWVTKDQVNDLITEHVDSELDNIDWDEKVKDVLRDML
jgi:regulator of replication initiation timing